MWNQKLYVAALNQIKKSGSFNGEPIKSKEDIYKQLSKILKLEPGTIKDWSRKASTGPGSTQDIKKLEEMLELPLSALTENNSSTIERNENTGMYKVSDFTKSRIMLCYELILDYIHDDNVKSEECFCEMVSKVAKQKIAIPDEIYNSIDTFIQENIAPSYMKIIHLN